MAAWVFFYQEDFGESRWIPSLATERAKIESSGAAKLTTALDIDNDLSDLEFNPEDAHYRGDLYFDFDASDLRDGIDDLKLFLCKLRDEYGVDLDTLRVYATGGRGFHVYVPMRTFIDKPVVQGYKFLPAIYKDVMQALQYDTLDFRVYTAKRGRMMRCANVERQNGNYKVPVTAMEAMSMTEDYYDAIIKAPRSDFVQPPTFAPKLALLFTQCKEKVDRAVKGRKNKKRDSNLLATFKGEVPPTIQALLSGEGIKEATGFHQIAMQLAVTAHGMGWTEDELVDKAQGVCNVHVSDGDRYSTPKKRERELRRMFHVVLGNPRFDWSAGAIKSLMDIPTPDLSTVAITDVNEDGTSDLGVTNGITIDKHGVFKTDEEGAKKRICAIGLDTIKQLVDVSSAEVVGYTAHTYLDGVSKGVKRLSMDYFSNRARFQAWTLGMSSSVQMTDQQVSSMADVLRKIAEHGSNGVTYTLMREGLDYITLPDQTRDIVWVANGGYFSKEGHAYCYRNPWAKNESFPLKFTVMKAPRYQWYGRGVPEGSAQDYMSDDERKEVDLFFSRLLRMNSKSNTAMMIGWFMSTFLAPFIREKYGSFPILQVFGTAGSGKTQSMEVLSSLYYYRGEPALYSASQVTTHAFQDRVTASRSGVLIIDEYKPAEMRSADRNRYLNLFRSAYNGQQVAKGQLAETGGGIVSEGYRMTTPLVFMAETMESQTAVVERCVIVNLDTDTQNLTKDEWDGVRNNRHLLSSLGRNIILEIIKNGLVPEDFEKPISEYEALLAQSLPRDTKSRQHYNFAVTLCGLDLLKRHLNWIFGTKYDLLIDELKDSIIHPISLSGKGKVVHTTMAEIYKVIETLGHMSGFQDAADDSKVIFGKDYDVLDNGVVINAVFCFAKYQKHCRSHGERPLFRDFKGFKVALEVTKGVEHTTVGCLKEGSNVFLIPQHVLEAHKIESFTVPN